MISVKKSLGFAFAAAAALVAGATTAQAQLVAQHLQPASVLVFPYFNSAPGAGTVISVTNTNPDRTYCQNTDYRVGDIVLHYVYIDGLTWREFDRYEPMTPGDTLSVLADNHNPEMDSGFLYVSAREPVDLRLIDFDYLIGSAIVVQSDFNFLWGYTPYAFQAIDAVYPSPPNPSDQCGHVLMNNVNRIIFSGLAGDYAAFPNELFIDSFFEQRNSFGNMLVLLSTAGQDYINEILFLFWNNREQKYSRNFKFVCWVATDLKSISNVAGHLNGDPDELGKNPVQTGWVDIRGLQVLDLSGNPVDPNGGNHPPSKPPILGVFMQTIKSTAFSLGRALQYKDPFNGLGQVSLP